VYGTGPASEADGSTWPLWDVDDSCFLKKPEYRVFLCFYVVKVRNWSVLGQAFREKLVENDTETTGCVHGDLLLWS